MPTTMLGSRDIQAVATTASDGGLRLNGARIVAFWTSMPELRQQRRVIRLSRAAE